MIMTIMPWSTLGVRRPRIHSTDHEYVQVVVEVVEEEEEKEYAA